MLLASYSVSVLNVRSYYIISCDGYIPSPCIANIDVIIHKWIPHIPDNKIHGCCLSYIDDDEYTYKCPITCQVMSDPVVAAGKAM